MSGSPESIKLKPPRGKDFQTRMKNCYPSGFPAARRALGRAADKLTPFLIGHLSEALDDRTSSARSLPRRNRSAGAMLSWLVGEHIRRYSSPSGDRRLVLTRQDCRRFLGRLATHSIYESFLGRKPRARQALRADLESSFDVFGIGNFLPGLLSASAKGLPTIPCDLMQEYLSVEAVLDALITNDRKWLEELYSTRVVEWAGVREYYTGLLSLKTTDELQAVAMNSVAVLTRLGKRAVDAFDRIAAAEILRPLEELSGLDSKHCERCTRNDLDRVKRYGWSALSSFISSAGHPFLRMAAARVADLLLPQHGLLCALLEKEHRKKSLLKESALWCQALSGDLKFPEATGKDQYALSLGWLAKEAAFPGLMSWVVLTAGWILDNWEAQRQNNPSVLLSNAKDLAATLRSLTPGTVWWVKEHTRCQKLIKRVIA